MPKKPRLPGKRVYYPFTPGTPKPRFPRHVAYMALECDNNGKYKGCAIIFEGFIYQFDTPEETVEYIHSLPPAAWLITYNLNSISCLFEPLINAFDTISGYERNSMLLDLSSNGATCYIVDIEQYFSSLWDAAHKLGVKGNYSEAGVDKRAIIVFAVWRTLENVTLTCLGVSLSKTPGATAMKSLRRFLPEPVFSRGKRLTKYTYTTIKPPALHWKVGYYPEAYLYDVNASYPHVMRVMRYPRTVKQFNHRPPPTERWIATVKLSYQTDKRFSPLSATTTDGEIIRPQQAQSYRTIITYLDLLVLSLYGKVEISEWLEGIYWKPEDEVDLFSAWAKNIENYSAMEPARTYLKVISRALHSKFAQRQGNEVLITTVGKNEYKRIQNNILDFWLLDNGELAVKVRRKVKPMFYPHLRPEWEALTLSLARYLIYSVVDDDTVYIDTDCIISTQPRPDLPIGTDFGLWKLQTHGPCYISGPRTYTIGRRAKMSGLKQAFTDDISEAIKSAVEGLPASLRSNTASGILGDRNVSNNVFTVRSANYPMAVVRGQTVWITRSPTVQSKLKGTHRVLFTLLTDD